MVTVTTQLRFVAPLDVDGLLEHFARRAVVGIEQLDGSRYVRSLALAHGPAVAALQLAPARTGAARVDLELTLADGRDEAEAIAVCRALLDLDADPAAVSALLGDDPLIGAVATAAPGRRVPGAAGATELCVRAILGQQISLAGAATAASRLVARLGEPLGELAHGEVTHLFPAAAALAAVDPSSLAMPGARARSLTTLAAALDSGELVLRRGGDPARARAQLLALPGVGPWTADYVVMRVLGDHDVFLPTDLGVRRALEGAGAPADPRSVTERARRWRPLRSYALQYVWGLLG